VTWFVSEGGANRDVGIEERAREGVMQREKGQETTEVEEGRDSEV